MMKVAPASAATKKAYADVVASLGADDAMKEWVVVPKAAAKAWPKLTAAALEHLVRSRAG